MVLASPLDKKKKVGERETEEDTSLSLKPFESKKVKETRQRRIRSILLSLPPSRMKLKECFNLERKCQSGVLNPPFTSSLWWSLWKCFNDTFEGLGLDRPPIFCDVTRNDHLKQETKGKCQPRKERKIGCVVGDGGRIDPRFFGEVQTKNINLPIFWLIK